MLDPRLERERHEWLGVAEERADCGIAAQQVAPHLLGCSRHPLPQEEAGTRHPVIEAQRVHPPFIYKVVHRGPVVGVGARGQARDDVREQPPAVEVTEQQAGPGVHAVERRGDTELARQKTTRT